MSTKETIRVGIDLGTTNTLGSVFYKGRLELLSFPGGKMLPSVLFVDKKEGDSEAKIIVGKKAAEKYTYDPLNGVKSAKTFMGDFEKKYVINDGQNVFTPTDVATEVLKEVKKAVLKRFKCIDSKGNVLKDVEVEAVITVPAYFNLNQKDETITAGQRAGFKVLGLITEPSAAAIYNIKTLDIAEAKIFVVDLGGGTFDVSVLEGKQDQYSIDYKPIAVDGDRHLGGDDFDKCLESYIIRYIEDELGLDLSSQKASELDYSSYYLMKGAIELEAKRVKEELSEEEESDVTIPNLFQYNNNPYNLEMKITREKFYELAADLFEKIMQRIKKLFNDNANKVKVKDIDKLILAGGSCYIPKVQADVQKFFGKQAEVSGDRSEMVVRGAGIVADNWEAFITTREHPQVDIISHSFGIAITKNRRKEFFPLLKKGEAYPCSNKDIFTTVSDFQESVPIEVYEAGSDMETEKDLSKHDFYGSFDLDGIQPALRGIPKIEVTFEYGADSRLTVTAKELPNGTSKIVVVSKGEHREQMQNIQPIDFVLMVDVSSSMKGNRIREAKEAAHNLVNNILDLELHRLGIVTFGDTGDVLCDISHERNLLNSSIDCIKADGWTNMGDGILKSVDLLKKSKNDKYIIIVSDGAPCLDYGNAVKATRVAVQQAQEAGIKLATIGVSISSAKDREFVKEIASIHEKEKLSYSIANMSDLRKVFEEIINGLTH